MRKIFLAVSAISLLSACAEGNADKDGDGKISAAEADVEAAKAGLKAGQWSKTVELVDVDLKLGEKSSAEEKALADQEVKSMVGQERKQDICLSEQDAKNPKAGFFAPGPENGCEYTEFSLSGGKLKTNMQCDAADTGEKMTVTMTGDYTEASFAGDYVLNVDAGDQGTLQMKGRSTMKRTGDCP